MTTKSEANMAEETPSSYPCKECQAGVLHLRYLTYFTWLDEELISVPNFPAWVCDLCGRREYDGRAIAWLTTMLNPDAGKPAPASRRIRPLKDEPRETIRPTQLK
jgi:YgiT-type zinc finger domain-containing protein